MAGLEIAQSGQRIYEPDGVVLADFLADRSHVSVIRGPIGSGTSSACCMKIYMLAMEQVVSLNGLRRSRWAVVRNSYPDLLNSTVKTWLDWFPEGVYGDLRRSRPMTHLVQVGEVELELVFIALDGEEDIQKLMSTEWTGIWFNELQHAIKKIFDEAESRTGRFPALKDGGSNWHGVLADMNAPDEDHWLPMMLGEVPFPEETSEEEKALMAWPVGWKHFVQPPALLEIMGPDGKSVVGYRQNALAENKKWLKEGFYEEKMRGKSKAWIDSRLLNKITFVVDGQPVWPMFRRDTHVSPQVLKPIPGHRLTIGMDFGRRPCILVCQSVNERFNVLAELRRYGMGAATFAPIVKRFLEQNFAGFEYQIFGDPKGQDKGQADERTAYEIFEVNGLHVTAAPVKNNHLETRISAVEQLLNAMHMGVPRFQLNPVGCASLLAAMSGRYHIRKGKEGEADPEKDKASDIADCLQYAALGAGEGRAMVGLTRAGGRPRSLYVARARRSLRASA